jgi:nucleoside-diphosphate-sugar epimerase
MPTVLVTGGAGFIGSHCVDRLLEAGYEVRVFDIKRRIDAVNLQHVLHRITYIEGDIRCLEQLMSAATNCHFVLHLAAAVSVPESMRDPSGTFMTNVTGTMHVFEAALQRQVKRVVYASSAAVYGNVSRVPTAEAERCRPVSHYGMQKVANEQLAHWYRARGLSTVGLRFFNVFGSRQDPHSPYSGVISIFAKHIREGKSPKVFGDGTATRDFVHVHDVANVCVAMATATTLRSVYNVGTGQQCSLNDLIATLNVAMGTNFSPVYAEKRMGDIDCSCAQISHLQQVIPIHPRYDLKTGLVETVGKELVCSEVSV